MVLKVALFTSNIPTLNESEALSSYNKWNNDHMQVALNYFNSGNDEELGKAEKELRNEILKYDLKSFQNKTLIRYMKMMTNIGDAALSPNDMNNIEEAIGGMLNSFSKYKAPKYESEDPTEDLDLNPDLNSIMMKSRDPNELKFYWESWHNDVGRNNKNNFFKYSKLRNEAAKLNNFWSGAEYWLSYYEDDDFEKDMESFLNQLMPLYKQLHGFVRYKLNKIYGESLVSLNKPIPVHLLGSLNARKWNKIADLILPYGNDLNSDVTAEMKRQNYNARQMFDLGEEFFVSLNLTKLPNEFYENSVIEKTIENENFLCHPSASDNLLNGDFHVSMCTEINIQDFLTVNEELGHVQYFQQYHHQPLVFRDAANPGFYEAIGDFISLSVATPKHLKTIRLLKDDFLFDNATQINYLMLIALKRFISLPFDYTLSKFRYGIFRGEISPKEANTKYWEMRRKYSGVEPPSPRTDQDFDVGSLFHVASDVETMKYFVSGILQFQLYKAACIKAHEYKPGNNTQLFHNCDIYRNTEVGNSFKEMLELGSSKPWPDALEVMTGQRKLDVNAMLEYFKPLEDWLINENKMIGVTVGWE
ncbi:unnamed protein product [Diamesa serratosioi]